MNPVPDLAPSPCSQPSSGFSCSLANQDEVQKFFLHATSTLKTFVALGITFRGSLVFRAPRGKATLFQHLPFLSVPWAVLTPCPLVGLLPVSAPRQWHCCCLFLVFLTVCVLVSLEALFQSCSLWKLSFTTSLERESSSSEHLWTCLLLVW